MAQTSIGQRLRQAREAIPASLAEASRATRVRVDFLEAMERDSFTFISGRVYVVGMLRSYARWLRLDDKEIAAEFERAYGAPEVSALAGSLTGRNEPRMPSVKPRKPQWAMAGAAALSILLVLLLASLIRTGSHVAQPPTVLGSPSPSATAGSSSSPAPTSTVGSAGPAGAASSGVRLVVATVGGSCWVHVVVGNTVPVLHLFQATLQPGVTRTFTAPDLLRVQFGNLGAVRLNVNGKDLGTPGALGQTGSFVVKPDATIAPDPNPTPVPPVQRAVPVLPAPTPAAPAVSPVVPGASPMIPSISPGTSSPVPVTPRPSVTPAMP